MVVATGFFFFFLWENASCFISQTGVCVGEMRGPWRSSVINLMALCCLPVTGYWSSYVGSFREIVPSMSCKTMDFSADFFFFAKRKRKWGESWMNALTHDVSSALELSWRCSRASASRRRFRWGSGDFMSVLMLRRWSQNLCRWTWWCEYHDECYSPERSRWIKWNHKKTIQSSWYVKTCLSFFCLSSFPVLNQLF